ncbi:MAG: metallophosphoesterase family protein [Chloroflexota bacterium]
MKFAILSDIHANLPALHVVADHIDRWRPDFVVVNGDVINRGPKPAECWRFIQDKVVNDDWKLVRGNHEEYVINHLNPENVSKLFPMSIWTLEMIESHVDQLLNLETMWSHVSEQAGEFRAVHASMKGSRIGIYPVQPTEAVAYFYDLITPAPAVICVGHTHLPMIKLVGETLIVNSGAAGQPCYGEKKACYAQVTWHQGAWEAEIIRLNYDRRQTQIDWFESGIFEQTSKITELIYHEWRTAIPLILKWFREDVPNGTAGMDQHTENQLISQFLENLGLPHVSLTDRL